MSERAETVTVVEADLARADHQRDVVALTDAYARDPMGNGGPLAPHVMAQLIPALRAHPTTLIFLAYEGGSAVGIATCFLGFSTFAARPLVNVHDLAVVAARRGRGIGRRLLAAVEAKARQVGCCKLTLEVQLGNVQARGLYQSAGFAQALEQTAAGGSLFFSKAVE